MDGTYLNEFNFTFLLIKRAKHRKKAIASYAKGKILIPYRINLNENWSEKGRVSE